MSETKYVRSYYLAEVNLTSPLCNARAGFYKPYLFCQLDGLEAPPIRGAKGGTGLTPSCLLVCIIPLLLQPSSGNLFSSGWMQFFQHLENQFHHLPSETPAVSWSPLLEFWTPGPWGQFLLKRQHHMKSHTCSAIIPTISFVL